MHSANDQMLLGRLADMSKSMSDLNKKLDRSIELQNAIKVAQAEINTRLEIMAAKHDVLERKHEELSQDFHSYKSEQKGHDLARDENSKKFKTHMSILTTAISIIIGIIGLIINWLF